MSQTGVTLANEMDAAVWTAIGLLAATSLGTLFYLGSRIDALAARLDARMDAGFGRVDAGFARVDARFDAIEASLRGSTRTWITTQPNDVSFGDHVFRCRRSLEDRRRSSVPRVPRPGCP